MAYGVELKVAEKSLARAQSEGVVDARNGVRRAAPVFQYVGGEAVA